ncbi:C-type lectin domain family 2 member D isoform X2 [Brienomyrus brachyistius]|uniref:C-type lectin domain family 2 member D isoform X2 n=1 Tax=Brienomyrus brachyistius TaxID=42636 RepID=UPI0020B2C61A|nr:C-type lectin domain family 2 member D isoform X2 [Brienomyrus brachyistius]
MELQKIEKLEVCGDHQKGEDEEKPGTAKEKSELLAKTGKDNEPDYRTLDRPTENIYETAVVPSTEKTREVQRGIRIYRTMSIILFVLTVILAAAVIALCASSQIRSTCLNEENQEKDPSDVCSVQLCNELYPALVPQKKDTGCHRCGQGWLQFENWCFLLSDVRETWSRSREQCRKWGADLAVIDNQQVQAFLTEKGSLVYWIGLSRSTGGEWTWINQTVLADSYWAPGADGENCGCLMGKQSPGSNWGSAPCMYYTAYICQKMV